MSKEADFIHKLDDGVMGQTAWRALNHLMGFFWQDKAGVCPTWREAT